MISAMLEIDFQQGDFAEASLKLMSKLAQGEQAGKEKGWLTIEEMEAELGIYNE